MSPAGTPQGSAHHDAPKPQPPRSATVWVLPPSLPQPEPDEPPVPEPEPAPVPEPDPDPVRRIVERPAAHTPVPLARGFDPKTGRRRVRIEQADGKVIKGFVGSGSIMDEEF